MSKPTARLIITFKCHRKCSYCSNNYTHILKGAKKVKLEEVRGYKEVCITGGEPSLEIERTLGIIKQVRKQNPEAKIFLYTAYFKNNLSEIVEQVDGVHCTLHEGATWDDVDELETFQLQVGRLRETKSFRLYINQAVDKMFGLIPCVWQRVEVKPWLTSDECKLPENEELLILEGE